MSQNLQKPPDYQGHCRRTEYPDCRIHRQPSMPRAFPGRWNASLFSMRKLAMPSPRSRPMAATTSLLLAPCQRRAVVDHRGLVGAGPGIVSWFLAVLMWGSLRPAALRLVCPKRESQVIVVIRESTFQHFKPPFKIHFIGGMKPCGALA